MTVALRFLTGTRPMSRWLNVGSLLARRLRRWPNNKPTLGQRLMLAGVTRGRPVMARDRTEIMPKLRPSPDPPHATPVSREVT